MEPILSPYIRRAWYNILMPSEVIGPRVIFDYELVLIKEGHADIVIEDMHYAASPGDMFIFRPRQPHCIYTAPDEQLIQPHIHFDLLAYPDREKVPISYQPASPGAQDPETKLLPSIGPWVGIWSSTPAFPTCPVVAFWNRLSGAGRESGGLSCRPHQLWKPTCINRGHFSLH